MELHLLITKQLNYVQFSLFQEKYISMLESIEYKHEHKLNRLKKKFINLQRENEYNEKDNDFIPDKTLIGSLVHNSSSYNFTRTELNVLEKGLNFNIRTNNEKETIFIDVETNLKYFNNNTKSAIRGDILRIIEKDNVIKQKTKFNNNNMDKNTLNKLKEKDVFYLKADKSNTVVIVDKQDYFDRVSQMIEDGPYEKLVKNPLNKFITSVSTSLKECKILISKELVRKLTVKNPIIPRIYCLPKIHKPGNKMRPIVSSINSPTYLLSKWLIQELQQYPFPNTFSIKDRYEFINCTKNLTVEKDEYLVSFDVTSLYPNVPIKETTCIIKKWLNTLNIDEAKVKEYLLLINLCMSQRTFQYKDDFYNQTEGTAMGNPLSCFIANIFMSDFETNAKNVLSYFPRIWIRYVDDVFAIFNQKENLQNFITQLNSFYLTIKFTHEIEENNSIPFLDVLLTKNLQTGSINFDIYQKPTQNLRFIPNSSFHPSSQKRAVFQSLIHRLFNTPLSDKNFRKEVNRIKNIAVFNGYKTKLIDNMIKRKRNKLLRESRTTHFKNKKTKEIWKPVTYGRLAKSLQKIFKKRADVNVSFATKTKLKYFLGNPKSKLNDENKSGIYEIQCNDCDKKYIGQTRRKIKTRLKEHQNHFKNNHEEKSAIAKHCLESGHSFSNVKLLKEINNSEYLDAYETLYIHRNYNKLVNNEQGIFQNSPLLI